MAEKIDGGPSPKYKEGHGLGVPDITTTQKIKNLERLLKQGPVTVSREQVEERIKQLEKQVVKEPVSAE